MAMKWSAMTIEWAGTFGKDTKKAIRFRIAFLFAV